MDDAYKQKQMGQPDDDNTPFSTPSDTGGTAHDQHPQTDTNVDADETYHHGLNESSGVRSNDEESDDDTVLPPGSGAL